MNPSCLSAYQSMYCFIVTSAPNKTGVFPFNENDSLFIVLNKGKKEVGTLNNLEFSKQLLSWLLHLFQHMCFHITNNYVIGKEQ